MTESSISAEVETWLRGVSADLTHPRPRECLMCFVHRMLAGFGCRTTLRFASHLEEPEPPSSMPGCLGVRLGSTQPCALWQARRRW